jgi:hypothetical protein
MAHLTVSFDSRFATIILRAFKSWGDSRQGRVCFLSQCRFLIE